MAIIPGFRRPTQPSPQDLAASADDTPEARATKGRATPTRKEAEAARKQGLKASSRGRGAKGGTGGKEGKKAAREAERESRARQRAGMMMGDERYMPARDRGANKRFVRDFVDARITVAEYFIFIAIAVLLLGFVQNPAMQSFVSLAFFAVTALIIIDTVILLVQLNLRAKKQFPAKSDRRGMMLYAVMRALQLRRLRLPPPMVTRGGQPIKRGPDGKPIKTG